MHGHTNVKKEGIYPGDGLKILNKWKKKYSSSVPIYRLVINTEIFEMLTLIMC